LATEVSDSYLYDWAIAEKWFQGTHPQIQLQANVKDLAEDPLPEAGLTVGIHPEVTCGGCWFQIIGSTLRSGAGGLCVFATFYDYELQTLLNMVDMYKGDGSTVEVLENPYYQTSERPAPPPMCHVVLVVGAQLHTQVSVHQGASEGQVVINRRFEIGIPIRVLGAEDCDRSRPLPLALVSTETQTGLEFVIPKDTEAGDILDVPVEDGQKVQVQAPVSVKPGDAVRMSKRVDGSWRVAKVSTRCSFLIPEINTGDVVRFNAPDGQPLSIPIPEGVNPGELVMLKRDGRSWIFDKIFTLPDVEEVPMLSSPSTGPYAAMLELLRSRCLLEKLPVDQNGTLHVNTPFCGKFNEFATLGNFLAENCFRGAWSRECESSGRRFPTRTCMIGPLQENGSGTSTPRFSWKRVFGTCRRSPYPTLA